ncbi:MAG: anthranilate synthase component 2 [Enterobacterales bacterium]|jgi:anthranilate synthase component 2
MLLMIDNYDSFTFNLVQYFRELGQDVEVYRNDAISIAEIEKLAPEYIVISPGPATPDEAGISIDVINHFAGQIPILGVCLGQQAICQAFGGNIIRAPKVVHGYTSNIYHKGLGVFDSLPCPFKATRYHSLVIDPSSLADCFEVTAWLSSTSDESKVGFDAESLIMGIKHKTYALEGIQFHPESILTEHGHQILKNFLSPLS